MLAQTPLNRTELYGKYIFNNTEGIFVLGFETGVYSLLILLLVL